MIMIIEITYPEIAREGDFDDHDLLKPAGVEVMLFEHPHNGPTGTYFSFDEAQFAAVFGSAIKDEGR